MTPANALRSALEIPMRVVDNDTEIIVTDVQVDEDRNLLQVNLVAFRPTGPVLIEMPLMLVNPSVLRADLEDPLAVFKGLVADVVAGF